MYHSKKIFFTLVIFFFIALGSAFAQPHTDVYFENGIAAYQANRYEEALQNFDRVVRSNPNHTEAIEYVGNTFFKMGEYKKAEDAYSRAIEKSYQNNRGTQGNSSVYQEGNLVLMEPNGSSPEYKLSMLYNNRGVARTRLNEVRQAITDFDEALRINPGLKIASENKEYTKTGKLGNVSRGGEELTGSNRRVRQPSYTYDRPISVPRPLDTRSLREKSEEVRAIRTANVNDDGRNSIFDVFKPKPFTQRNVPGRGRTYKEPGVGAASQNYISIENVQITPKSTIIHIKVRNDERKPYEVSISRPKTEGSFVITNRTGTKRYTLDLIRAAGIEYFPQSTRLDPGAAILISLEFPKIPDDMGFINLIEAGKQDEQAWNFYNIDLTK